MSLAVHDERLGAAMMDTRSLLLGFRYLDTFFPSGGFAFSSGLETAVQEGNVQTSADLNRYVADYLRWGLGRCEAVALARGHHASFTRNLEGVLQADHELEAMKLCRETRTASRQMGRSLLHNTNPSPSSMTPSPPPFRRKRESREAIGILQKFREAVDSGHSPGHWAVVLGVNLQTAEWDQPCAVAGLLYQAGIGFLSASYKLLSIGQREGQRLLEAWIPLMVELSQSIDANTPMTSWAPVQDIYAMRHARLSMRLFRS